MYIYMYIYICIYIYSSQARPEPGDVKFPFNWLSLVSYNPVTTYDKPEEVSHGDDSRYPHFQ